MSQISFYNKINPCFLHCLKYESLEKDWKTLMKLFPFLVLQLVFSCAAPVWAEEPSLSMLKQITQAGGSLILDLEKQDYTVSQLVDLASSLKYQSTLTIKMVKGKLSPVQCAQIAKARPGQVIFWF